VVVSGLVNASVDDSSCQEHRVSYNILHNFEKYHQLRKGESRHCKQTPRVCVCVCVCTRTLARMRLCLHVK
jgi:hypothetical protein